MSDPTNRTAVENLTVGQHISDSVGVHELVHRLPYRDANGSPMHALTLRPLAKGEPWVARHAQGVRVVLASDEEIREYRERGRRAALAAALHALADDIIDHRLPVSASLFDAAPGVLGSRADLERWAAYLGTEVKLSGQIPIATATRPVVDGLSLHFHTQCSPEPEPAVEVEQDWLFTFGVGQLHDGRFVRIHGTWESARARMLAWFGTAWCDQYDWRSFDAAGLPARVVELPESEWPEPKHWYVAGATGGPGECSAVCACSVVVAGFDTLAEAIEVLNEHIANPEPDTLAGDAAAILAESGLGADDDATGGDR